MALDELGLAYEDRAGAGPGGKGRHRRGGGGGGKKGSGGRTAVAFLLVLIVLGGIGVGGWWAVGKVRGLLIDPDYNSAGTGEVQIQVLEGQNSKQIGETLQKQDVVKSAGAFFTAAKEHPRGDKIQPGYYKVRKQMRAKDALKMLLETGNRIVNKFTIREGLTLKETYAEISKATTIPVAELEAAGKDPRKLGIPDFWFKRNDNKPVAGSLEGFLFPETYEIEPNQKTAEAVLKAMVKQFTDTIVALDFIAKSQNPLQLSPYEALIVASLVQAESGNPADDPKIARVVYNRLFKAKPPMVLEFDSTTNYGLMLRGQPKKHSGQLTDAELKDPTNTYSTHGEHHGLPPGPIGGPGKAALQAAVQPEAGSWIFFVLGDPNTKTSLFATTNAEHEANIKKACANGVKTLSCK